MGKQVEFNTVSGKALAFIVDEEASDPNNPDNDKEVVIFPNSKQRNPDTGLTGLVEYRYTHYEEQAGGISRPTHDKIKHGGEHSHGEHSHDDDEES